MRVHRDWIGMGTWSLVVWLASTGARADGTPPLMVVVEVGAGVGQDAADIRKAIGAELHRTVVAPSEAASTNASDLLLVVVNHDRIVLSLHERSDERVSRSIAAPADKAARLRAVTWLAGNVARDQVTPLLTLPPAGHADAEPAVAPVSAPAHASTEPPPLPGPATPDASSEATLVRAAEPDQVRSPWTITVAAGDAEQYGYLQARENPFYRYFDLSMQAEVLRHRADGYLYGAAADFGPSAGHRLGLALVGGAERDWGRFTFEASFGLGVETAASQDVQDSSSNSSLTGRTNTTTVTATYAWRPYARLFASISHPVTRSWDVVLRAGGHAPVTGFLDTSFAVGSLGVRLRWP